MITFGPVPSRRPGRSLAKNNAGFSVVESLLNQKLIIRSVYQGQRFYLRWFHPE
ncbi:MAG: hypothetical protein R2758_05240 [Bacteroidales bacterium]